MARPIPIVLLLAFAAQPAAAQVVKPPAPVSADPASTSATFGDWVMRCQRVGEGDKARRLCEVAQVVQSPDRGTPVAEVALGRPPGDPALHLTAVLPTNVSFPSSVLFAGPDHPPHAADLQWRRCLPGGCFADAVATEDNVKAWRGATDAGHLAFKDAAGRDVALPISFRGLAQALDALGKS